MDPTHHPEMDDSELLDIGGAAKYQMMVGSLNWLVTLGRFDIYYVTQTMARFGMAPQIGHFEEMKRTFGYLQANAEIKIIYDTRMPVFGGLKPTKFDWTEFYPDATEEMPPDMPAPKG